MNEKRLKYIFLVFILVFPVCIIYTRILPFIDLPFRLMASTIMRYYDSPGYIFSQYYTIPTLFKSNIFHLIFCSLKIFPDVETANKIYYIIYFISFPSLLFFLIKKLGYNKWFSILGFFVVFNSDVHWGFADYTMSLSVLLLFILILKNTFDRKNASWLLLSLLTILVTFFVHFQMSIYECVLFVIFSLMTFRHEIKKLIFYLLSLIPIFVIMALVYLMDANRGNEDMFSFLLNYYINVYPSEILVRLQNIFFINNYHLGGNIYGVIIGLSVSAIIILPAIYLIFKKKIKFKISGIAEIVMLTSLLFYFILPDIIPGQNLISSRFAEIFFIGLILFLSETDFDSRKYLLSVNILLFLFFIVNIRYFAEFNKVTKGFDKSFFDSVNKTEVVTGLIDKSMYKDRPVFVHFHNYYTVWNKGISTGLIDYRYGVIRRKAEKNILPDFDPWSKLSEYPKDRYLNCGYLLLKSDNAISDKNFNLINSVNDWKLYKRNY